MRQVLTTIGELVGGSLIAGGVWSFSRSLGLIAAGVLLALFSWLVDR